MTEASHAATERLIVADHPRFVQRVWCLGRGLLLAVVLVGCPVAAAPSAEPTPLFEQANQHYERGQYTEAAAIYQQLLASGNVSSAVYFNLGNAYFKAGEIGKAVLSYRLAERLDPRDSAVKANLRFARGQAQNRPSTLLGERFIRSLTLNELTVLFVAAYWICLTLLTVRTVLPEKIQAGPAKFAGAGALLIGLWLWSAWQLEFRSGAAIVIADEAVVRYGPVDESQSFFTVSKGAELMLLDQKDRWLHVRDSRGRAGWVPLGPVVPTTLESLMSPS